MALLADLRHAVTRYDRAQARGKRYNPNALGIYLGRCEEVAERVAAGESLQPVLQDAFCDRLLDRVLISLREQGYPVAPSP
jgi:hypothetical protein